MANYINIGFSNPASGSTDNTSMETENKLKSLAEKIKQPSDISVSLDGFNKIVGEPIEKNVPVEDLLIPNSDWTRTFKIASEDEVAKMAASIYKYGLLHRVTLWQNHSDKYTILGGMTRVAAFKYLYDIHNDEKWLQIPAKIYSSEQLDEIDAHRIFIVSNTDQRQMSVRSIANAYYDLIKLEKERSFYGSGIFARNSAAKQAGISTSSFSNYLKLVELYPPLMDKIDQNLFQISAAFELAYAPEDIQKYVYDKEYYLNMKRKTARKIRHEALDYQTVDKIIQESLIKNQTFIYKVDTRQELPRDCEILPLFVNKKSKEQIIEILAQAIDESALSDEIKLELHENLGI